MKNIIAFSILLISAVVVHAQAPQLIQYQAVARSAGGDLLQDKTIRLRINILDGSPGGPVVYQETHLAQTNPFGLFTLQIGGGTVLSGSMAGVNWASGSKFVRVELDPNGGTNYINMGVNPLLSVPYALHAASGGTNYAAGQGIQINGQTITNTGDNNANDDLLVTTNFSGDVTGLYNNLQLNPGVVGSSEIADQSIQGTDISAMGAAMGDVLKWTGSVWAPGADLTGGGGGFNAGTGIDITGSTISALNDNALWNALKLYGRNISSTQPNTGQVLKWDGTLWAPADDQSGGGGSYSAGSGISITGNVISALTAQALWNGGWLQGRFVADNAPSNGQALVWNASNSRWEPQTLSGAGLSGSGTSNYLSKFTGTNSLGNSLLYESLGRISIGTTSPQGKFHIAGTSNQPQLIVQAHENQSNDQPIVQIRETGGTELMRIHTDHPTNVFLGLSAGIANQVSSGSMGQFNSFVGSESGFTNDQGSQNTALGYRTLYENGDGSNNSVVGAFALRRNQSGNFNTAMGANAMENTISGSFNSAFGYNALNDNDSGINNTGLGALSLNANNSGNANTAIGHRAMFSNSIGSGNVALGQEAMYLSSIGNANVAIGTKALYRNAIRSFIVAVGDSALFFNSFGAIDPSQAIANTAIGSKALMLNTIGSENTALGYQALLTNSVSSRNTAIGFEAMYSNQLGEDNAVLGHRTMYQNNSGHFNTAIGNEALFANNSGSRNTAVGAKSMLNNFTGNDNTAVGYFSLEAIQTGDFNTATGYSALKTNNSGHNNTAVGAFALEFSNNQGNTALGYNAGGDLVLGSKNTYIGFDARNNLAGYSNSTALGAETFITGSNMVRIGNASVSSIGGYANWSNISDGRIKRDIREDVKGLDFIRMLRPVTYHLDLTAAATITGNTRPASEGVDAKEQERITGFIAQEVEDAARTSGFNFSGVDLPDNANDLYSLRYAEFVVPLVKAIQEQQSMIEAQQKEINLLKEQVKALLEK